MKLSQDFLISLRFADQPQYKVAQAAGINPTTLSKLVNGITPIKENDPKILRVAEVLNVKPEQIFSS